MRTSRHHSNNYRLLRLILSKVRKLQPSQDVQYLLIYSFLYKYCSDVLKEYAVKFSKEKSISPASAWRSEEFKNSAFERFGFYIASRDYIMDAVLANSFSDRFFIYRFFEAFAGHLECRPDSNYRDYFNFIFQSVDMGVNFKTFEFEGENHLMMKDIIHSISKLDVFDERFPFSKVFDRVCQTKPIMADHDPDYINYLISSIVSSNVKDPKDIYNPFLNDASLLINLSGDVSWKNTYAKSQDEITYCCSIVKLLMNSFDLDEVYSDLDNPFEPFADSSVKFDVIMSRFPPMTSKNLRRINYTQRYEIVKNTKKTEIRDMLSTTFDIDPDSFEKNSELKNAFENLITQMDGESDGEIKFTGEYASLERSEYLFLINMINSLKDDGIMVVSMAQSFLVKNSLETLRKYLTIEKNYIDAIISIPNEFSRYSNQEIIAIFKKHKQTDDIVFIDMSNDYSTKKAPYATPGVLRGNLILDESTTRKVNEIYRNRQTVDKFSEVVRVSQIKDDDFNLSISRYVDTFEGEFIDLDDLKDQKEELTENMERLNKKIEKMMDDLDIKL